MYILKKQNFIVKKKKFKFFRRKLKKKWRFWRSFKFFFLRRYQKKNFFFKLIWNFNYKRILWHQLSSIYGKKIKNLVYSRSKSKKLFNKKFIDILCCLELRLNILLLRICFSDKLIKSNQLIKKGKIKVNGFVKHQNYIVLKNDFICYFNFSKTLRINKRKWRRYMWKRWKRIKGKNKFIRSIFFSLKKNYVFNFIEINYRFFLAIVLRKPLLGEIIYKNKKQLLTRKILHKIYFLY